MRARNYVRGLMLTHQEERPFWGEPEWSAYHGLLIAMLEIIDGILERPPCDCDECRRRVREGRSPGC